MYQLKATIANLSIYQLKATGIRSAEFLGFFTWTCDLKWVVDKMAAGTMPASFSGLKNNDSLPGCLQKIHARKGFVMPNFLNPRSSSIRIRVLSCLTF